jgi:hypothetical protein
MPGPMPAMGAKPPAQMQPQQFTSNSPGGGAQVAGVNSGLQYLNKAAQLSGQTTQAQQQQLGTQLQQNQANVAQNMTNKGLGNTSISQTMAQAPLQSYNLGMAQVGDLGAQRQMQAYGNLANASAQGGSAITGTAQPYAQTNFTQQKMQQLMGPQATYSPGIPSDFNAGQQAGGGGGGQYPNLANAAQSPLFQANAGSQAQGMNGMTPDQLALAMQGQQTGVGGGDGSGGDFGA